VQSVARQTCDLLLMDVRMPEMDGLQAAHLPLIDANVFERLQANAGADFVVTLVAAFIEDAPQLLGCCATPAPQATATAS
jgi:CheY-like chemotaxis protein